MQPLMPHQIEGVKYLLNRERCLLGDEAGLGKSRQVLEAAKEVIGKRRLLVLCPTSIAANWKIEAQKWDFPVNKLTVVGYEYAFLKHFDDLTKLKFGAIVADEAHMLRNWTAQRTVNFKELIKGRDSRLWFLTGTPLVKGAQDLHPLFSFIEPGKWGKYYDFCEKFCQKRPNEWRPHGYEYHGSKNEKQLNAALGRMMLRRYKDDVIDDLPDKIFTTVPVDCGTGSFDVFTNAGIIRSMEQAVELGGVSTLPSDEQTRLVETQKELGLKKVDRVVKFCEDILFPHPTVVFAHHRLVVYDIAEKLRDRGRKVEVLIGGVDKEIRQAHIAAFQDGKIDDLVVSIGVGGVGINLFRSSRCVFAEYPWTWAALEQAADRLHRIGQKDCVNVYMLVAKDSFEERQVQLIEQRKNMTEKVMGL